MPSGNFHKYVNKKVLGSEHEVINRLLDSSTRLSGPRHRKDFVHSIEYVVLATGGDPKKVAAAIVHLKTDNMGLTVRQGKRVERVIGIDKGYELHKKIKKKQQRRRYM